MKRVLPVVVLFFVLLALVVAKETSRARLDEGAAGTDEFVPLAVAKFAPNDAARVEVTAPGGTSPALVVERVPDPSAGADAAATKWLVTTPFRAPAHLGNVEDLCAALAGGDAELRADDAGALRDFDLVPERATAVRVTDAAGKALAHVAVGRSTGSRGAFVRFLSQSDTRAFETTADLRGLLGLGRSSPGDGAPEAPKASHFRDLGLPSAAIEKPKRVEVVTPGRRLVLEKADGKWAAVEGGPGLPVNQQGVDRMLAKFGPDLRADDLDDPADLAKLGLAAPAWSLAATLEDGTVRRIVGSGDAAADAWRVRLDAPQDPDVVYRLSSWEFQQLFPQGSSLVEFPTAEVPEDKLTRVVVEAKGVAVEMTREGTKASDDWKLVRPDWPLEPRQSALRSLGALARSVRATDWTDTPADGFAAEAVVRVGARGAPDADLATIAIGGKSPSGKDRLAILPNAPGRVLVLADSTVDRLLPSPTSLFEPKVFHGWTAADVRRVAVETPAGGDWAPAWSVEPVEGGWTLVRGAARDAADGAAVGKWIDALLALETAEPVTGDEAPEARVTVTRTDGTTRSVALSAAKDGARIVTLGTLRFRTSRAECLPAAESLAAPPKKE